MVISKMTSTTYYSPSSTLSRHSSKYSSNYTPSSSKFYLNSGSSSSSSASSSSTSSTSSYLRTRSSYDLNTYRPSSYISSHSSSPSFSSKSFSSSSSYLSSKYTPGSTYSATPVTLTRFNQRRTSLDYNNESDSVSKVRNPVAGLTNLGNTCYMNSVLQALYSSKELRDFVITCLESGGQLYTALSRLFKEMTSNRTGSVNPSSFRSTFIQFESKFRGYEQQDAQEFLRYLINGLHDELNKARHRPKRQFITEPKSSQEAWNSYRERIDDSKLIELFVGQFSSVIKCTECNNESTCWDPFWDLSLAVPRYRSRVDIDECLAAFTEQETLDGNEQPFCSNCKKHRRSTKRLSIVRSPKILIIHLKKFSNDGYKLSSDISVNQTIKIDSKQYELFACVCHHGFSSRSGHYTAYCQYDSKWYHLNDEKVKDVTDSFSMSTLKDAYVLFYRQESSSSIYSSLSSKYSSRL